MCSFAGDSRNANELADHRYRQLRGRQTTSSRRAHPRPHLDPDHQALLARITSPTTLHVTAHYKPSERLPLNIGLRISYVPFIAEHDQTPTPFKRTYPAGPTQSSMNHMMTFPRVGALATAA